MRTGRAGFRPIAALAALAAGAALAAACGGLAHPVSNDGADVNNRNANPGSLTLNLNAINTQLAVGDTETMTGTFDGLTVTANGILHTESSDSTVLRVGGMFMQALSVGEAVIDATYEGYPATLGISVVENRNGVSAEVAVATLANPPAFTPSPVNIQPGATVSFYVGSAHNVVFDSVPGRPENIPLGVTNGTAPRTFATTGTFTYQCTLHGERGVINVVP
jgi:plastocyanin